MKLLKMNENINDIEYDEDINEKEFDIDCEDFEGEADAALTINHESGRYGFHPYIAEVNLYGTFKETGEYESRTYYYEVQDEPDECVEAHDDVCKLLKKLHNNKRLSVEDELSDLGYTEWKR